jgi:hypothetical protein
MSQLFPRSANALARSTLAGGLTFVLVLGFIAITLMRSPWLTRQNEFVEQPLQFSHAHHVGGVGLDAATAIRQSRSPRSRESLRRGRVRTVTATLDECPNSRARQSELPQRRAAQLIRVNDLPDFVFFNHQIHVRQGVGCAVCHGPVDRCRSCTKPQSLQMEWCLDATERRKVHPTARPGVQHGV